MDLDMNLDIVFHVDLNDSAILGVAISNVMNYFTAIEGKKADVVMLVNGPAVNLFKKEIVLPELKTLQDKGLTIKLCQNALNKFSLTKEMVMEGVQIVPAGIVELVRLKNEHYTYIKP